MKSTPLLFCGLLTFLGFTSAHAQVLLIVDASNPNAVTITGTGVGPLTSTSITGNSYNFSDGIVLEGIFAVSSDADEPNLPSTLTTGDASSGPTFNSGLDDGLSSLSTTTSFDLDVYSDTSSSLETFTSGQAAFNPGGILTLDLSGSTLSNIHYGVVQAGNYDYSSTPTTVIGTYELIVPEPSTWALVAASLTILAFARRSVLKLS